MQSDVRQAATRTRSHGWLSIQDLFSKKKKKTILFRVLGGKITIFVTRNRTPAWFPGMIFVPSFRFPGRTFSVECAKCIQSTNLNQRHRLNVDPPNWRYVWGNSNNYFVDFVKQELTSKVWLDLATVKDKTFERFHADKIDTSTFFFRTLVIVRSWGRGVGCSCIFYLVVLAIFNKTKPAVLITLVLGCSGVQTLVQGDLTFPTILFWMKRNHSKLNLHTDVVHYNKVQNMGQRCQSSGKKWVTLQGLSFQI